MDARTRRGTRTTTLQCARLQGKRAIGSVGVAGESG